MHFWASNGFENSIGYAFPQILDVTGTQTTANAVLQASGLQQMLYVTGPQIMPYAVCYI